MQRIHVLMSLPTSEEYLELRSVATDAASAVAEAVGKEKFAVSAFPNAILEFIN